MKKLIRLIVFIGLVVAIVLYASGVFQTGKVEPGRTVEPAGAPAPAAVAQAERARVPLREDAVGTIQSRRSVEVAAQVTARVVTVTREAGESIKAGEPLVMLDDRAFAARLAQARDALSVAKAGLDRSKQAKVSADAMAKQAKANYERVQKLLERGVATTEMMELAEARYLQTEAAVAEAVAAIAAADAGVLQARNVVAEAEVALGHTRIPAPISGAVAERTAEPGDLALSGRTLLVLLDPSSLRLEAQVREGLIGRIRKGDRFDLQIPAVGRTVPGVVDELIPAADPLSRTFRVRVNFDAPGGVHPGMFARLRIPLGEREVVRVPAAAVARVGQLETVLLEREAGRWQRRLVTTGTAFADGTVEVLSGLKGGERVGLERESERDR